MSTHIILSSSHASVDTSKPLSTAPAEVLAVADGMFCCCIASFRILSDSLKSDSAGLTRLCITYSSANSLRAVAVTWWFLLHRLRIFSAAMRLRGRARRSGA